MSCVTTKGIQPPLLEMVSELSAAQNDLGCVMRKLFNTQRCYFYSVSKVDGAGMVKECCGN